MPKHVLALVFTAMLAVFVGDAQAVTIDWSPVGNPGNLADTKVMRDGTTGYGSVAYNYRIGTYDVTNNQYVEFLNTKDPTGANAFGLYNPYMSSTVREPPFGYGGIDYNFGAANGSKYSVMPSMGNHPVNHVTWYDAARFANWLNNGQGNGDTETGAYTIAAGATRSAGARVFLPSEDEWYKAAYYDPRSTAQGGPPSDSHYWLYPTSSNALPTGSDATAQPNHANTNGFLLAVTVRMT